jgi:2-polyprenyl-6-methoxyphenol hydroxylase-like FAD-dependent oxidoreductase
MMASGQHSSAIVVGGGIGGLAGAIALRAVGWSVTVLERREADAETGSGISLWPNATRVLDQLGLGDQLRRVAARLPTESGLRTPSGRWLKRTDNERLLSDVVLLRRSDLREILLAALPAGCIEAGVSAESLDQGSQGVRVLGRGASGPVELEADLVVAADGIKSTLRRWIVPSIPDPLYSGYTTWRGIAPPDAVLIADSGETWGRGAKFGYLPLTGRRVYWFAELPASPKGRNDDERAALLERFGSWHHPIPSLIRATPEDRIIRTDVDVVPDLPTYVSGAAALLGDAAHGMPPDLGQGGCQALEDAAVLAARLARGPIAWALRAYDQDRRPRTQAIAKAARRMGRISLLSNPTAVLLRDAMIALTPARAAAGPLTQITRWNPPPQMPS